jgi:DNA-binding beta-propeller fold protein YncE
VGGTLSGLAVGAGGVWVADQSGNRVVRIDPATNRIVGSVRTRPAPVWFAIAGRQLWVADQTGNAVQRIDPATGRILATVPTRGGPLDPGLAGGSLWVPTGAGRMWRIRVADPNDRTQSRWPPGIFVAEPGAGSLWLLDFGGSRAWRIAPSAP